MLLKISQINQLTPTVKSFIFKKPTQFFFYPGQYLDYQLKIADPQGNSRSFTISASPTEDFLMLTTRQGRSVFKQKLFSLKSGDSIESSHPAGTFILDESSPAVFIAGGIGITPFRSMIKYIVDQKLTTQITLIYSNSDPDFLFKKELEDWKKSLSNLTIIYHNSSLHGYLNKTKLHTAVGSLVNNIFYLAGSPNFVNTMEKILKELGVDQTNIRYDRFDGYL